MVNDPSKAETMAPPPSDRHGACLSNRSAAMRGIASRMLDEAAEYERADRIKTRSMRDWAYRIIAEASDIDAVREDWEARGRR